MSYQLNLTSVLAIGNALDELTRKYIVESERVQKGLRLFLDGKAEYRESLGCWICVGQFSDAVYAVDLDLGICSCGDALNRRVLCKHWIACWIAHSVNTFRESFQQIFQLLDRADGQA